MLLPRGQWHRYAADSADPWTLFWVHFQGTEAQTFLEFIGYDASRPVVTVGGSPVIRGAFESLMAVRRTGYSTRAFIKAANQLRHLLSEVALEASVRQGRAGGAMELERVQAFMREHLNQNLSLDELAASANMSKYHFSARYKALSGYSPVRSMPVRSSTART
jgi:hypothetical protein